MESKVIFCILALVLLISIFPSAQGAGQVSHLLIYEISPYPYPKTNMEYVCILNPSGERVSLKGYYITDFEGKIYLNGSIAPNSKFYIAQNSSAFFSFFGFYPNITYAASSGHFALANSGDEVALYHGSTMVDLLLYGKVKYGGKGWSGAPLKISVGHVLRRIGVVDTNTPADWTNYHVIGQSDFKPEEFNSSIEIFPYPDKWKEVLRFVRNSQRYLLVESYTLTSVAFQNALLERMKDGVKVKILLDGNPIGGISEDEKYIVNNLWLHGANISFMVNSPKDGIYDRYRFLHAKFIVRDGKAALVSTENFDYASLSPCGHRGYGIIVRSASLAKYLQGIFEDDDKHVQDIKEYRGEFKNASLAPRRLELRRGVFQSINLTAHIAPVLAPDFSVSSFNNFVSSQRAILVEALYIDHYVWNEIKNKTYLALVQYPESGENVKKFNGEEHYIPYLHAKLIIGDSAILVGSMNFGKSSIMNNRELSLIVHSPKAISYVSKIFYYDWNEEYKPIPVAIIKTDGKYVHFDLSRSIGKITEYYVYLDGELVHKGKNPVFTLKFPCGSHRIRIVVKDYWDNEDSIEETLHITGNGGPEPRIPLILILVALFLYKVWKDHG